MLLRFSVANHLSIKDTQALSLIASSLKDEESGLIECAAAPEGRVLPAVVIYGANASGKSNFIAALEFMRFAVLYSQTRGEPRGGVARTPFALHPACAETHSIFDLDFVVDGVRYHYGFEANNDAFVGEWLYALPSRRRQLLFERQDGDFKFGRMLRGRNKVIADLTRPNSLFVSAAAQNDHEQLSNIAGFFQSTHTDTQTSIPVGIASASLARGEMDSRVINFLHKLGTGVIDYRIREQKISEEVQIFERELSSIIRKTIKNQLEFPFENRDSINIIELAHRDHHGDAIFFDLDRESAGTRRLLLLLGQVFRALDRGTPMLIDELDASLHTQACEAVLALFSSPESNPKGAQLIATTHDTNLLRSPLLRRDQIWFTEKDSEGATHLYPLTDIRTRKGDNIEKGYLQGRYGAIPFSGAISDLVTAA